MSASGGRDGFFKMKPTKRSNPEERTTLDVIHQCQLKKIEEESEEAKDLSTDITFLKQQIETTTDDLTRGQMENQLVRLEEEFQIKNDKDRKYDYFLNTGELLFKYYDIQTQIHQGAMGTIVTGARRKPGDVLSALESAAGTEQTEADNVEVPREKRGKKKKNGEGTLNRDSILEQYLMKINPAYVKKSNEADDMSGECAECGADMEFSQNEAMLFCPDCGLTEFILIDSDRPSYKDPPRESSYYAYKRINHFNELLAQFQAKGSTEIPQDIFDQIMAELQKQRITDFKSLKPRQMREVLRKLKLNRQYDHIPYIISRLNGSAAPVMDRETEEKLRHMFKEIQPSFQRHCPKNRRNFLSYSYVLYKFCELLELDEFLASFPLLKNRDKLYQQSKVWQAICAEMGWEFIKSI
jgi:predicted  nucleic acid-binding Zn-ribbon protein